eukprot:435069-Alexandrium_andersonii.AAC.1
MSASLVGSEMCIRDRRIIRRLSTIRAQSVIRSLRSEAKFHPRRPRPGGTCLLYTSDAADDM